MTTIGSYAAKTHLPELLDRVANGETFTITKRGRAVAMLVPIRSESADTGHLVREMLYHRDQYGPRLGKGLSVRKLRDEGKRY